MKKCSQCAFESEDAMRFCLNCGAPLAEQTAFGGRTQELPASPATAPGARRETETFLNNRANFAGSVPPPARPKSGRKIWLVAGGIVSLLFLLTAAGAAIFFYNFDPRAFNGDNRKPTPAPTSTRSLVDLDRKSPAPKPSAEKTEPKTQATPEVSFTPPIEPTKSGSFTVYANEGWQLSDIDVVSLEQFTTTVQGAIDLAGIKTGVSSKGLSDPKTASRRLYQDFPTGALLMRTRYADGRYSNMAAVTAGKATGAWQNYPDETGKLEFRINDNAPESNGGQFTVNVKMTSVPKRKK